MTLRALARSAAALFHRSRVEDEMDEELRSHIQHRADDLERSGIDRAAAERRARLEFGGHQRFKEECREAIGIAFIDTLVQDLRFTVRLLRKSPGFTFTAATTLALGIGANAVVFSVLNAFILRPLDVPDADSLYQIERGPDKAGAQSYPDYVDLRDRNRTFDDLAAFSFAQVGLDTGDNPTRAWAQSVTGNYFDALRIQPHLGRLFHASDEHGPNSVPYIVLGHAYWHTRFQDDPTVVGRVVRLNKHPYTIVGVAPPGFHGTLMFFNPDLFVPLLNEEQLEGNTDLHKRGTHWIFMVMGHLKPGVTTAQAIADLSSIGAYLEKTYPKDDGQMTFALARPGLYGDFLGPVVQAFLIGLMLLAALILLAACANLGSLFAARAADRSREVALRLALGASRARILRQLFTEAVLIALMGGAAGVSASVVVLRGLSAWQPFSRFPIHVPVTPDRTVYAVALLVTIASGFVCGAVPVRQTLRTDPYEVVKAGSTGYVVRRIAVRDLLLVVQIAICAVLVTASLVAVRGLLRSQNISFGFEIDRAMLVDTDLSMAGYKDGTVAPIQKRMIEALQTISGTEAVGLIDQPPLWAGSTTISIYRDMMTDLRPANAIANPVTYKISPGYFQAAGTALLAGRAPTWHDDKDAPRVAVVNQEFARRIFGSVTNAVGSYYKIRDGSRIQVVGVVEDGKYTSFAESPQLAMFFPIQQSPTTSTWLVVRSSRDPRQLTSAIRTTLRDLDPAMPFSIETWKSELESGATLFGPRMATASLGVLGAMGAMLSVTGIFGLAAYSLSKRKRELGIRMALGAQRAHVLRSALGRALKLLAIGSGAGLVLGILASRVLAAIVYQASPRDPVVLAGVVVAMALLGLLGTWIPAQRALSVSPLMLLREE
ncbi:MAG TPA: ABC transporter permease [Vicinamibacterales bacterium]|nr:ABC transporter permease [Vicinamibacterales bacterium]